MMRVKQAGTMRCQALGRHRTIGNPDAFMLAIHNPGLGLTRGFLGAGAGKKRTVEQGQLQLPGVIGNGDGEDAGVLVVHVGEINALKGFKGRQPDPFPMEQILRHRQGNSRSIRRKRRVSHDVMLERLDKGNPGILAAAASVRPPLVISFRLQRNAETFDSGRVAGFVEFYAGNADA